MTHAVTCVSRAVWHHLLKTTCRLHHNIQLRQKDQCYHIKISSHCSISLILNKVWSIDASDPKSTPNSVMMWMHLFFDNHMWFFRTPNAAILGNNKAIKEEICFNAAQNDLVRTAAIIRSLFQGYFLLVKIRSFIVKSYTFNNPDLSNCLFLVLPTLYCTNGSKFKFCVNFGTPDIISVILLLGTQTWIIFFIVFAKHSSFSIFSDIYLWQPAMTYIYCISLTQAADVKTTAGPTSAPPHSQAV